MTRLLLLGFVALTAVAGVARAAAQAVPASPAPPASPAGEVARNDYGDPKTWLCRPGRKGDACDIDLTTTVVAADGSLTRESWTADPKATIDCFYVYPTVSTDPEIHSDMNADPAELISRSRSTPIPPTRGRTRSWATSGRRDAAWPTGACTWWTSTSAWATCSTSSAGKPKRTSPGADRASVYGRVGRL